MIATITICCFIILIIISQQVSSFQQFTSSSSSSLMKKKTFLLPTTSIRHNIGFDSLLSVSVSSSSSSLSSSSFSNDNDNDKDDDGIIHLTNIDRVYVISDLHTDSLENLNWLRNKTLFDNDKPRFGPSDLIIVAGDISHELDRLQESLQLLLDGGSKVVFVPGNHEAWLHSRTDDHIENSIEKLNTIQQTCHKLGVLTTGRTIQIDSGSGGSCGTYDDNNKPTEDEETLVLWIVPLESWYDATLTITNCEDLCDDFYRWPWVDFIKCIWPKEQFPFMMDVGRGNNNNSKIPMGLTEYFINKNQKVLQQLESSILETTTTAKTTTSTSKPTSTTTASAAQQQQQKVVLTVSHFLPNQRCLPDWKDLNATKFDRDNWLTHGAGGNSAKFAKVAGTQLLDDQIRNNNIGILSSGTGNNDNNNNIRRIHLFGHSHRPKDFEYNGIRYIHNPLGKPREREMHLVSPKVDFQLLWDTRGEIKANETIIRYWEEKGGGVELLKERMKKTKRRNRYDHKHMKKMKNMVGGSSSSSSSTSSSSSLKKSSSSSSSSRFISSSSSSRKSDDTK